MGQTKTDFNADEFFIDGQHTPEERRVFMQSTFFPIAVAMYNTTNKAIRVGKIGYVAEGVPAVKSALIVSPEGFMVGKLKLEVSEYKFFVASDGVTEPDHNVMLSSVNPNYVRAKLSKSSKHVAVTALKYRAENTSKQVSHIVRSLVDNIVDTENTQTVSRRPSANMPANIVSYLADIVAGKSTLADMPLDVRTQFEDKYKVYASHVARFHAAVDAAKGMFDQDKWLLVQDINGGVIFGSVSPTGVLDALDIYKTSERGLPVSDHHEYAKFSVAPKWYPNYEAIPEECRRELDYSLMMLKVHANSNSASIFPATNMPEQYWPDIGAAVSGKVVLLPKC